MKRKKQLSIERIYYCFKYYYVHFCLPLESRKIISIFRTRPLSDAFNTLNPGFRLFDGKYFIRYWKISPEKYEHLLNPAVPLIQKKQCRAREVIPPSYSTVYRFPPIYFQIGGPKVCNINDETAPALSDALQPVYLQAPCTCEKWTTFLDKFGKE